MQPITLKEELQRPFAGELTLGELARPLCINKADAATLDSARMSYEWTVERYKQTGTQKDHQKMIEAFSHYSAVAKKTDLRFALAESKIL